MEQAKLLTHEKSNCFNKAHCKLNIQNQEHSKIARDLEYAAHIDLLDDEELPQCSPSKCQECTSILC